jgi:hypothetical protein
VVQKWEKTLSLISEVIDMWLSVQRKWLYMEGIFVEEDVRERLSEDARKFDDIDLAFRKVPGLPKLQLNINNVALGSCLRSSLFCMHIENSGKPSYISIQCTMTASVA